MADGLKHKYSLTKADGRPVDPAGIYFVLKLNSQDEWHARASRKAVLEYATSCCLSHPQLSEDLRRQVMDLDEADRREAQHGLAPGALRTQQELIDMDERFEEWFSWSASGFNLLAVNTPARYLLVSETPDHEVGGYAVNTIEEVKKWLAIEHDGSWETAGVFDLQERKAVPFQVRRVVDVKEA